MADGVVVEDKSGVRCITIDRPEKRNAITMDMYAAMADAVAGAEANDDVRAILFLGHEEIFTGGNDLADFMSGAAFEGDNPPVMRFLAALASSRVPMVAGVSGGAIGIGATMLLHCDLVYADESAYLHMPFADLALVPEAGSSYLLPRRYGSQIAAEFLILSRKVSPHRAYDMGIVNEVVSGDVKAHAFSIAEDVAAKPPIAMRLTKQLLRDREQDALAEHIIEEGKHFASQAQSDEMRAAVMAKMASRS